MASNLKQGPVGSFYFRQRLFILIKDLFYWCVVILVSFVVLAVFLEYSLLLITKNMELGAMVKGTAPMPFVSRALIPAGVRAIDPLIPKQLAVEMSKLPYNPAVNFPYGRGKYPPISSRSNLDISISAVVYSELAKLNEGIGNFFLGCKICPYDNRFWTIIGFSFFGKI
jgi:hypothetical protein